MTQPNQYPASIFRIYRANCQTGPYSHVSKPHLRAIAVYTDRKSYTSSCAKFQPRLSDAAAIRIRQICARLQDQLEDPAHPRLTMREKITKLIVSGCTATASCEARLATTSAVLKDSQTYPASTFADSHSSHLYHPDPSTQSTVQKREQ